MEITRADLFPTTVFDGDLGLSPAENQSLVDAILAERARDEAGVELSNYRSVGGWHSRATLHKDPEFALFASAVRRAAAGLAENLGYDLQRRLDIDAMWAIVNGPGASNRAHIHPGALWSGVYYVRAEDGAGRIELLDPRTANLMRQPRYTERPLVCHAAVSYDPIPGRILLFPGWLYHTVDPNLSGEDRVILSFNLSQY